MINIIEIKGYIQVPMFRPPDNEKVEYIEIDKTSISITCASGNYYESKDGLTWELID